MTSLFSLHESSTKSTHVSQVRRQRSYGRFVRSRFFAEIDQAIVNNTAPIHEAVLEILAERVADPDLLDGISCAGSDLQYTRVLLHAGPGYSILAITWRPGQMSPVHGHAAWCALGIHQGELVETCSKAGTSEKTGRDELKVTGCRQLVAGAVSGSSPDPVGYHRVANLGVIPAISIHVYGAVFDRLGTDLNRPWTG